MTHPSGSRSPAASRPVPFSNFSAHLRRTVYTKFIARTPCYARRLSYRVNGVSGTNKEWYAKFDLSSLSCRKLLSATVRRGKTGYFYWIGSDSWGAKIHPVRDQEWAAEGAITILPKRSSIKGRYKLGILNSLILEGRKSFEAPPD